MDAFIYVRAKPGTAGRIVVELMTRPGVRRAVMTTGTWDILGVIEAPNMATIGSTVLEHVQTIDGVERTLTAPVVPPEQLGALGGGFGLAGPPQLMPGGACYVHVRAAAGTVPALFERLSELEAVRGVAVLAGEHDLIVEVPLAWESASGVILEQIQPLPGVLSTTTMIGVDLEEPEDDRDQFSAWS